MIRLLNPSQGCHPSTRRVVSCTLLAIALACPWSGGMAQSPAGRPANGEPKQPSEPPAAQASQADAGNEKPKAPPANPPDEDATPSAADLYEAGKALFDTYAPPEIKEQYEFPSRQQWDDFSARLQRALDSDNLAELADYLPEARSALGALRVIPGYEDYAAWLQERIDYIEAAQQAANTPAAPAPPATAATPVQPSTAPSAPATAAARDEVPYYELWLKRVRERAPPEQASRLMPTLRAAFVAEGVPPELAWLAEAESSLNPAARSPAGARGLFQLMPETARNLGLSTFMPDERTDVEKSARAAARYLRQLHEKFGTWPLAFAAYNAGEGRVERLLRQSKDDSYAAIAGSLRSETRMYVPKVCAMIAVRGGVPVAALESPRPG